MLFESLAVVAQSIRLNQKQQSVAVKPHGHGHRHGFIEVTDGVFRTIKPLEYQSVNPEAEGDNAPLADLCRRRQGSARILLGLFGVSHDQLSPGDVEARLADEHGCSQLLRDAQRGIGMP